MAAILEANLVELFYRYVKYLEGMSQALELKAPDLAR